MKSKTNEQFSDTGNFGIFRVPSYAYEDPAEVIFYPSALSPETAGYGALEIMPASPRMINDALFCFVF